MVDVIDSTLMHINDLPRPNSTLTGVNLLKHDYFRYTQYVFVSYQNITPLMLCRVGNDRVNLEEARISTTS